MNMSACHDEQTIIAAWVVWINMELFNIGFQSFRIIAKNYTANNMENVPCAVHLHCLVNRDVKL